MSHLLGMPVRMSEKKARKKRKADDDDDAFVCHGGRNYRKGEELWGPLDDDGVFAPVGGSYLLKDGQRAYWGQPPSEDWPGSYVVTSVDAVSGTITIDTMDEVE